MTTIPPRDKRLTFLELLHQIRKHEDSTRRVRERVRTCALCTATVLTPLAVVLAHPLGPAWFARLVPAGVTLPAAGTTGVQRRKTTASHGRNRAPTEAGPG